MSGFSLPNLQPLASARLASPSLPIAVVTRSASTITPVSPPLEMASDAVVTSTKSNTAIVTRLNLQVEDSNGFAQTGKQDVQATLTGTVKVQPSFILKQLSELPDIKDIVFKPPVFDEKTQQYVLSGKAENKILGLIDIGFEVRLAAHDDHLSIRVNNGLKRGIIYKILSKQLAKLGMETEKKDKFLHIKPTYKESLELGLKAQGLTHASIENIDSHNQNLQFAINKKGELSLTLKEVGVTLSTDGSKSKAEAASHAEKLSLNLNAELDENLQPSVTWDSGKLSAAFDFEKPGVLPESLVKSLKPFVGSDAAIDLTDLKGKLVLDNNFKPKNMEATGQLKVNSQLQASAALSIAKNAGQNLTFEAVGLQGALSSPEMSVVLEPSALSGTVLSSDKGSRILAKGHLKGSFKTPQQSAAFSTSGNHNVHLGKAQVSATLDQLEATLNMAGQNELAIETDLQHVELNKQGKSIAVTAEEHRTTGLFKKNELDVSGDLSGALDLKLEEGVLQVESHSENTSSTQQAQFKNAGKMGFKSESGSVKLEIPISPDAVSSDIHIELANSEIKSDLDLNATKIKAHSQVDQAEVNIQGSTVSVKTRGGGSDFDVKVKQNIRANGRAGDLDLTIGNGGNVDITVAEADAKATIRNGKGSLNVEAHTVGQVNLSVSGNDVDITGSSAQTMANLRIQKAGRNQVVAEAAGKDFSVKLSGKNIDVALNEAHIEGDITPGDKVKVDVASTAVGTVNLELKEKSQGTDVKVTADMPLKGDFELKNTSKAAFDGAQGFALSIAPDQTLSTTVKDISLQGNLETGALSSQISGQGDFALSTQSKQVSIDYAGRLKGSGTFESGQSIAADFTLSGKSKVEINGKDMSASQRGSLSVKATSNAIKGAQTELTVNMKDQPLELKLENKQLRLSLKDGGYIEASQLSDLQLPDEELQTILKNLKSQSVKVSYKDLEVAANDIRVQLKTEGIQTTFGNVDAVIGLEKSNGFLQSRSGQLAFTPNRVFYDMIQSGLSEKYNLTIQGEPSFENGEIRVKGEVKTSTGMLQLADFAIEATVKDNKLIFDFDKARVLGVVATNTVGKVLNKVLSKTDIDVFKKSNTQIELSLGDIVKDLSLTQGINFTGLKLVENRFEVDFYYNSLDQQVAKLTRSDDNESLQALSSFLKSHALNELSGESISTAYTYLINNESPEQALALLKRTTDDYLAKDISSYELERALVWMAKSKPMRKAGLEDDMSLEMVKHLNPVGHADKIRRLPEAFVTQLANNLDQTLSQGGGFRLITSEERSQANALRTAVGLPLNRRPL